MNMKELLFKKSENDKKCAVSLSAGSSLVSSVERFRTTLLVGQSVGCEVGCEVGCVVGSVEPWTVHSDIVGENVFSSREGMQSLGFRL